MEQITKGITNWLIKSSVIDDIDRELYEYAIYSMLITISPMLLVLIIGMGLGTLREGMILIVPFMCIRKFSGGYHAKNAGVCFVSSCVILVICMHFASHFEYDRWFTVITTVCVLSLCVNSPIDSENKRLDDFERRRYQRITIGLSGLFYIVHCACVCVGLEKGAVCIAIGICMAASLQLPCLFQFYIESGKGTAN